MYEKYKNGLKFLQNDDYENSEILFNEILSSDFFEQVFSSH